jgi:hypothetical protein
MHDGAGAGYVVVPQSQMCRGAVANYGGGSRVPFTPEASTSLKAQCLLLYD